MLCKCAAPSPTICTREGYLHVLKLLGQLGNHEHAGLLQNAVNTFETPSNVAAEQEALDLF